MTNYNERLDDVLSAVYLAGTENGLNRRLTDAEEIMHRKKAFINGNHVSVEAKQAITSLIKELEAEARIDPFEFVESCEPDCDDVRHAYHQGQWDMATRIEAKQEEVIK